MIPAIQNKFSLLFCLLTITLVSGCNWTGFRQSVGLGNQAPDEFLVKKNKSLEIPDNFTLPEPGKAQIVSINKTLQAKEVLVGDGSANSVLNKKNSALENQINNKVGSANNKNIRGILDAEHENRRSVLGFGENSFMEKIVDPFDANKKKDKIIDGAKENARIRKAISEGDKINSDEAIVYKEEEKK